MSAGDVAADELAWGRACAAAAIWAVAPARLGGLCLRARHGPTREDWLAGLKQLIGGRPVTTLPPQADDAALFGGLDIAATLAAGRRITHRGALARAAGGLVRLASAERISAGLAARLAGALDAGEAGHAADIAVLALDEGADADERVPDALAERLALQVVLDEQPRGLRAEPWPLAHTDIAVARERLTSVAATEADIQALCETAMALGIESVRAPVAALEAARIAAALEQRTAVQAEDLALATQLVLAPRARRLPSATRDVDDETAADSETDDPPAPAADTAAADLGQDTRSSDTAPPESAPDTDGDEGEGDSGQPPTGRDSPGEPDEAEPAGGYQDQLLEAARAALPADVLADLAGGQRANAPRINSRAGRRGSTRAAGTRGRPVGVRAGMPGPQQRLDILATLRAAAPWQTIRGRTPAAPRLRIRATDFRVRRYEQPQETATLFVVDASGSSALHRLAETKGAVELLLADCYIRRDRVGLIAFRGPRAETLLPPTRSLTRAKRALGGLPGGGPTPLADGIDSAARLAGLARRDGLEPLVVLLTDGRGNIARDGRADRRQAAADTAAAARGLAAQGVAVLVIDTSPRPRGAAQTLAEQLGARYLPLPQADAARLSSAIREAAA